MILQIFAAVFLLATTTFANSPCGDWDPYLDEKCVKVFDDMLTYEDALKACHLAATDASLLSIQSTEEQVFMEHLLYDILAIHDPLWLGAKFDKVCKRVEHS